MKRSAIAFLGVSLALLSVGAHVHPAGAAPKPLPNLRSEYQDQLKRAALEERERIAAEQAAEQERLRERQKREEAIRGCNKLYKRAGFLAGSFYYILEGQKVIEILDAHTRCPQKTYWLGVTSDDLGIYKMFEVESGSLVMYSRRGIGNKKVYKTMLKKNLKTFF